jgi:hypothetical protein
MKAKLEFEAARQQKMLKIECEAKMQQKMKAMLEAMLEFEAARQQKLPQFQEPPVSVPPLGGDAGWTEAKLQKMDNKTIVKVIDSPFFSIRFLCSCSLIAHSRCTCH